MGKLHPTNIQWCTHTVNPVVAVDRATGKQGWACTKVATGCMNCYAEALNIARFGTGHPFDVASESLVEWRLDEAALESVLRRQKFATIFWGDMTDLFHERVPDAWLDRIFAAMAFSPHLRHIVLTKRPERMREYFASNEPWARSVAEIGPFENVALGTSVSNQVDADRNIPHLLDTPAALRFVSYEPATGPVNWERVKVKEDPPFYRSHLDALSGVDFYLGGGGIDGQACIDAIIIGGESGPQARPFDLAWARGTIAQCDAAGVVAMVKQLGARPFDSECSHPSSEGVRPLAEIGWDMDRQTWRCGLCGGITNPRNRHGGDPSEWPEDLRPHAASSERWPWAEVAP